jgi:hypothetical protein
MRQLLEIVLEDEAVMRAVAEASVYDQTVRDFYNGGVEDYARALSRMIRGGRRDGRLRDVDPVQTAQALAWMTERTVSRAAPGSSADRLDAIAEAMADVFWRTLFPGIDPFLISLRMPLRCQRISQQLRSSGQD